jgi:excisionase family DNA binding protein
MSAGEIGYQDVLEPLLITAQDVARLLKCSDRHVTNLRRDGRMPPPVKLGTSVRWPRRTIEEWISAGCPSEIRDSDTCK